jgi:hypothetical protein
MKCTGNVPGAFTIFGDIIMIELTDYQKDLLKQLETSGLKVTIEPIETGTSKSDLKRRLLELAESGAEKPETPEAKKRRMLELAANGSKKPEKSEKLGIALRRYCTPNGCYDAEFDKLIRNLRPDWFATTATETKEELLKLAESGASRPNSSAWERYQKNPLPSGTVEEAGRAEDIYHVAIEEQRLGRALINYTNKSRKTYDADFDAKIRALRTDWFN